MSTIDLITILGNLGQSLGAVSHLISGLAYILGIVFLFTAIHKLKMIGDARANSPSQVKMFVPLMYIIGGAAFIFLPSAVNIVTNTAFGAGNVLQYSSYNKVNIVNVITWFIRVAGLIWFIRGAVLLVHASEPGVQEGPKGLTFLIAGILAINFNGTVSAVNYILKQLFNLGSTISSQAGF
jgi:hypothetical protein